MRAKFTCRTQLEEGQLEKLLKEHHWWPEIKATDNIAAEQRNLILDQVYGDDRGMVERTHKFLVHDDESRTWGIVNRPNTGVYTFRMKNASSDRLKYAVEKMIKDLTHEVPRYERDGKPALEFRGNIEVLEPASDRTAFYGTVINAGPIKLAIKERRRETAVGIFIAGLAFAAAALSSPPVAEYWTTQFSPAWAEWVLGNLARMATAGLAAAIISWSEVYLHYRDIRREAPVRWFFERSSHAK